MSGTLYIVATPIGNLEDLTFRALKTLEKAAVIACEDTRQTRKLLTRYSLSKKLISYFQPHEGKKVPEILGLLERGADVALVSDSGTPGISDPGYRLINEALAKGVKVVPIPGPSAVAAALSAAGLPTHRFLFIGFPSPKKEAARKLLASLKEEEATIVFYVPARRLNDFLLLAAEELGDRQAVVAREMTKIHEEFIRGQIRSLLERLEGQTIRGEVTLLVRGKSRKPS